MICLAHLSAGPVSLSRKRMIRVRLQPQGALRKLLNMPKRDLRLYIDYKSPYAYLAKDPAYELEREFGISFTWLPYVLQIPDFLGTVEGRNPHQWRRVRYSYMDARRLANRRRLMVGGPQKIFDSSPAAIGMIYAQRRGAFRSYNDLAFERFWRRELDIEDREAIHGVLKETGIETAGFFNFLDGEGRGELALICREAEEMGVFGVPTFVLDGELFWGGDRIWMVREKLASS
jgi:2-hydroxychromene-2-carboxylate isomerase